MLKNLYKILMSSFIIIGLSTLFTINLKEAKAEEKLPSIQTTQEYLYCLRLSSMITGTEIIMQIQNPREDMRRTQECLLSGPEKLINLGKLRLNQYAFVMQKMFECEFEFGKGVGEKKFMNNKSERKLFIENCMEKKMNEKIQTK